MNDKMKTKYQIISKLSDVEIKEKYGNNVSSFLANLLFVRKIEGLEDTEKFLNPKWEDIFDPFLFKDMEKVVERILKAIKKKEKILIFSDYDTDGIPGGAILKNFFEKIGYKNFKNFIPNRNKDGYGLTENVVEKIVIGKICFEEEGSQEEFLPDLVITVDCGISDLRASKILKKSKIDLIVTDHHIAGKSLPYAFGILNHKVRDDNYPEELLCGSGITFKLVQALFRRGRESKIKEFIDIPEGWEKWLLDLVAISTICDMVPLQGENRVFAKYGKIVLEKTKRAGLKKIIEKSRLNVNNISADDVAFMIGPRINAASRLEHPKIAFSALSENNEKGVKAALELEKINNRRKYLLAKVMKNVWQRLKKRDDKKVIVIGDNTWPVGILGLISGRVADKLGIPVFVWTKSGDGKIKGSCRSGGKMDVYSLMEKTRSEFIGFGGHSMSGGFEISEEKIHSLEEKLFRNLKKSKKIQKEKIIIDEEISIDDVNMKNYQEIEKMAPFGIGNQKPLFFLKDVKISWVNFFGKDKAHLELSFRNSLGQNIKSIAFFYKDNFDRDFNVNDEISLVVSMEKNQFNGANYLRLKIEDVV